ncbi:Ig-like domain-containing protein [Salmonella enterica]
MKDKNGNPVRGEAPRLKLTTTASGIDNSRLKFSELTETQPGTYTGTLSSTLAVKDLLIALTVNGKKSVRTAPVTVTADTASATPALEVITGNVVADGKTSATMKVTVTDQYGNKAEGQQADLTAGNADNVIFQKTPVTTNEKGEALFSMTSLLAGQKTVTATLGNGNAVSERITFVQDPNVVVKALTVTDNGGTPTSTREVGTNPAQSDFKIAAEVLDPQGKPALAGTNVKWTLDQSSCQVPAAELAADTSVTDAQGHAVIMVTSAAPHKACNGIKVTGMVEGATQSAGAVLNYIAEAVTAKTQDVTLLTPQTVYQTKDKEAAKYMVTVKDQYDNMVKDATVNWSTTAGTLAPVTNKTDENGNASTFLTSKVVASNVVVSAVTTGIPQPADADQKVEFRDVMLDNMIADAQSVPVGDGDGHAITFTATVKDSAGAVVPNERITWAQNGGQNYTLSDSITLTDAKGQAKVTLITSPAHKAIAKITVSATFDTMSLTKDVAFTADAPTASVTELNLTPAGDSTKTTGDTFHWIAKVHDQYGNLVDNATITWSLDNTDPGLSLSSSTSTTSTTGEATVGVTGKNVVSGVRLGAKTVVQASETWSAETMNFVAAGAATMTTILATDGKTANGTDEDVVVVNVKDSTGHALTGVNVTVDLSKSPEVQTTDGKTSYPLDPQGNVTVKFVTTRAGDYPVTFMVPDSSTVKAATTSTTVKFVAGPVDAAHSRVDIPVTAAPEGNPLDVNVYLRDAYANPVPYTTVQNDLKVTPTAAGVTLTTSSVAESGTGNGQYITITLQPSEASYTRAIRSNKINVAVGTQLIGTSQSLSWAPSLKSDNDLYNAAYDWSEIKSLLTNPDIAFGKLPNGSFPYQVLATFGTPAVTVDIGTDPVSGATVQAKFTGGNQYSDYLSGTVVPPTPSAPASDSWNPGLIGAHEGDPSDQNKTWHFNTTDEYASLIQELTKKVPGTRALVARADRTHTLNDVPVRYGVCTGSPLGSDCDWEQSAVPLSQSGNYFVFVTHADTEFYMSWKASQHVWDVDTYVDGKWTARITGVPTLLSKIGSGNVAYRGSGVLGQVRQSAAASFTSISQTDVTTGAVGGGQRHKKSGHATPRWEWRY